MRDADNSLSLAASAIWRTQEEEDREYALDGSGDCGDLIARGMQEHRIAILARHGFTPETYNAALRDRMIGLDGRESLTVHRYLGELEVEPMDEWLDNNTFACTVGYLGHPSAEFSSLAYLKGD